MRMDFKQMNALEDSRLRTKKCPCKLQLCNGSYIPSRIGQEMCIKGLAYEQKLKENRPLGTEHFDTEQLVYFLIYLDSSTREHISYDE